MRSVLKLEVEYNNVFEKMANKLVSKEKIEKNKNENKINSIKIGNKNLNIENYNKERGTIEIDQRSSKSLHTLQM